MTIAEALVGKTLVAYGISEDRTQLVLRCADGTDVVLVTTGECCSETWIEGIDDATALEGGRVMAVEQLDLETPWREQYQRVRERLVPTPEGEKGEVFYGLKITTTKGRVVVDYRNSNAYYGGALEVQEVAMGAGADATE